MSDGRRESTDRAGSGSPQTVSTVELVQLVEAGADWIWETNHELRFSWLSDGYQSATGIAPEEMLGRSSLDLAKQISTYASGAESHLANIEDPGSLPGLRLRAKGWKARVSLDLTYRLPSFRQRWEFRWLSRYWPQCNVRQSRA